MMNDGMERGWPEETPPGKHGRYHQQKPAGGNFAHALGWDLGAGRNSAMSNRCAYTLTVSPLRPSSLVTITVE